MTGLAFWVPGPLEVCFISLIGGGLIGLLVALILLIHRHKAIKRRETKTCPACKVEMPTAAKFCPSCSKPMEFCPTCGKPL